MGKHLHIFKYLGASILMILVCLFCCDQSWAGQDAGSAVQTYDLTVEASVPAEICFRNETGVLPVTVSVSGTDASAVSLVKLTCVNNGSDTFTTLVQQAVPAEDGRLQADFMMTGLSAVTNASFALPVRIELVDENGVRLARQVVTLQTRISPYSVLTAVLSQDEGLPELVSGTMRSLFPADSYSPKSVIRSDVITDTNALVRDGNIYRLLIADRKLKPEEAEDVMTWICSGGYALITENSDFSVDGQTDKMQAVSCGTGYYLMCGSGPLTKDNLPGYINLLCGEKLFDFYQDPDLLLPVYPYDLTSFDAFAPVLRIWPYRIILLLFVLAAGPGLYMALKKRDKLEYLWICIPVTALVFSALLFAAGSPSRFDGPFVRYFRMMRLTAEGIDEKTVFSVTTPGSEPAVLSVADPSCTYHYETTDMYASAGEVTAHRLDGDEETVVLFQRDDCTDIMTNPEGVFSNNYFRAHQFKKAGPDLKAINADICYDKGRISGTVSNDTGMDLEGVFAVCHGICVGIGSLDAGETKDFDLQGQDYFAIDQLDNEAFCEALAARISVPNPKALVQQIQGLLNQDNASVTDHCFVGGFTAQQLPAITGISEDSIKGLSFIMQPSDDWHAGEGRIAEIAVTGRYANPEEANIEGYAESDEPLYYDYSDIAQEYVYQFGMNYQPDYIRWLNPEEGGVCEWYNVKTGEYDRMFEQTDVIEGAALSDYLDAAHLLKVRYQGAASYMVPVFSSFGGEVND